MDCFSGISRKKGLELTIAKAVKLLKTETLFWDAHLANKPSQEGADKIHHQEPEAETDIGFGKDSTVAISPDKAKDLGGGHNVAVTNLQHWQGEGKILKKNQQNTKEAHDKAINIKALFSTFERILRQAANRRWDCIVEKYAPAAA